MIDFAKEKSSIFFNGKIITLEEDEQNVEAVFVENGIIKSLGSKDEIMAFKKEETTLIDLEGKTMLPGFIDSHTHPALSTFLHEMIDLSGFTHSSPTELWNHLNAELKNYKKGEWVICRGFDPILIKGLEAPHIDFLDSIAPENPILIISQSLHSFWTNSKGFELAKISKDTPDPTEMSFYEKDKNGELTGFIAEQEAIKPFNEMLEESLTPKVMIQATREVFDEYARNGNTTIVSAGLTIKDEKPLQLYEHFSAGKPKLFNQFLSFIGYFPKRKPSVRHFIYARHDRAFLLPDSPDNGDDFYRFLGIKHWYDGSPYTGSMYLKVSYMVSDLTKDGLQIPEGYAGKRLVEKNEMVDFVEKYQRLGWQIAVHVQGDAAIEETIEAFEKVNYNTTLTKSRHRLEHCLLLSDTLIKRMSNLNMTPSIHVNHLYYYGEALRNEIIGEERADQILPVASVKDNGLKFSFHADQPMFKSDPMRLIQTAVLRKTKEGNLMGDGEQIEVLDALKAMTIHAAWQIKMEDKIGSIKEGKYADFVILNKNPLEISASELENIEILKTYVHGNELK
jgi:predicted amidohydrolase YtcJ